MLVGIQNEILRLHSMKLLELLLIDRTTKTNIIWATDAYQDRGKAYQRDKEIQVELITGDNSGVIKNRARKALEQQSERTRQHAEVFTPLWICQKMVSHADEVWFEGKDPFAETDNPTGKIEFPKKKNWTKYIDQRRLEITCGEAPYLVNRYDVATGEEIPVEKRQGILDRKLRVVNENAADEEEWLIWALRSFQQTYGYEFQGDNLLIARLNLLMTYEEFLEARWNRKPTEKEYRELIKTITWNIWQMDGLTGTIPYCKAPEEFHQVNLFELFSDEKQDPIKQQPHSRTWDWRRCNSLEYLKINTGGRNMKFDFVIGNPPYQQEFTDDGNKTYAAPVYNQFLDAAVEVSNIVELIHPARFLFNAGSTPKPWNDKMLNDEHFKVLKYEEDATKIFPNTDIKGGIAITYHDSTQIFDPIIVFTKHQELNEILKKVNRHRGFLSMETMVVTRTAYRLTVKMHEDHPEALAQLSKGHPYDMSTNIFERLPQIFHDTQPKDDYKYIRILGRENNERVFKYVRADYVNEPANLNNYKVYLPSGNGNGKFGEVLTAPVKAEKGVGATETFISIGSFESENEVEALMKYIKSKFARAMVGVLKTTQHLTPAVWKYVPIQDFTSSSDIDWSKSISEIDQQLYKKYNLDNDEINFIESHVKEMA